MCIRDRTIPYSYSILSQILILSPHTNYFVNNRRQDRGKSRLHLECICPFLWTAHRFLPIEPNRCATALAGHRAAIWFNWNLSYNNLYMHKKQYIYENTLNPKSTQFIFPYIKCSRIFHFLTKCFPYQNFKIIDIKFWKECISIFNI